MWSEEDLCVMECSRKMRGVHVVPPLGFHGEFTRIFGWRTLITDVRDIIRESRRVGVERFTEEVEKYGDQSIKLGVSWELDMERYVGEGRWRYLPRLAVLTVGKPGFQFMQSGAFVEYAANYYAELMDGVTSCEEELNEGHNSEEWSVYQH